MHLRRLVRGLKELLKREMSNLFITAVKLKSKYPKLFQTVATMTICRHLQKDLVYEVAVLQETPAHFSNKKKNT